MFAKHCHLVERLNKAYITQLTSMYLELTKSIILVVQFFKLTQSVYCILQIEMTYSNTNMLQYNVTLGH